MCWLASEQGNENRRSEIDISVCTADLPHSFLTKVQQPKRCSRQSSVRSADSVLSVLPHLL